MPTPQKHIDKVNEMVAMLQGMPSINEVSVNDFGRHSNFDVWVWKKGTFANGKISGGSFRPAIQAMKKYCKDNGMIYRGHFLPHRTENYKMMKVDIDFVPYDPASNTFEGHKPEGNLAEINEIIRTFIPDLPNA